ncbi:multidrug effflux MFS transporter [Fluviispira multicolorata]|uniref:multidrug effflux MFS transporter n=1 Tax=Fluviispira multicolorata TaxID=2654512 RepID=UPI001375E41E|nr:multidrug effflux MFS transporter [Fluviispira multicolorata]
MKKCSDILKIFILILVISLPSFSTDSYIPSLPHMIEDLNTTQPLIQLTLSFYMIGFAISMLTCGSLSDRFGRRPILLIGLSLFLISSIACMFAPNVWFLIIARFFQALGGCCGIVLGRTIVRDSFEKKDQVKVLTYMATGMAISPAIAPIIGGVLQTYFGWRSSFLLLIILSAIILVMVYYKVEETNKNLNPKATHFFTLLKNYKEILSNRTYLGYTLTISFAWCAYFSFISSSSFIFQDIIGVSSVIYGVIFALVSFGYICGTIMARKLSVKFHMNYILFFAAIICLLSSLILFIFAIFNFISVGVILFPIIVLMFGIGIIFPLTQVGMMDIFPKMLGIASGLFFFIEIMFGVFAGYISGSFKSENQLPMASVMFVSCLLLILSYYALIIRKKAD